MAPWLALDIEREARPVQSVDWPGIYTKTSLGSVLVLSLKAVTFP